MDLDETSLDPPSIQPTSQDTTNWPLESSTVQDNRGKRRSLRVRPSLLLENAEPPSPLNLSFNSAPPQRAPKMSLFNLFNKPKVERQRGYAEKGVDVPVAFATKSASASTPNLVVQVQSANAGARAPSAMSFRPNTGKPTSKSKFQDEPPPVSHERKNGPFVPPPLFQAYPQSMKEGTLEISTLSAEAILHKTKSKKGTNATVGDATAEDQSFQTKRTAKSTLKHVANGSSAHVELPRKIFVLVTSGYLLQYAESGPSDRLPEKMLHLGKESAAFACDLVPGKHYVLQVSRAVDQQGVMMANSGSIFSKLGLRSAAAKRLTSGLLLVMPSAREMESWMTAIRQEIESLGGKKIHPEPVRPRTGDAAAKMNELKKAPSQSHRFQVKRNPSKVSRVTSPTQASFPTRSPKVEPEKADADTIDGIEIEASKLDDTSREDLAQDRATSDAPSVTSSTAISVEQQQLNTVRSSVSYSNRTSHTSQAGTVATTVGTSRSNSLVGSPPSPRVLAGSLETAREGTSPLRSAYRPMASYGPTRRRSAVPLPTPREGHSLPAINTSPAKPRHSVIVESPVGGRSSPAPPTNSSPKRLMETKSEPNLKGGLSRSDKHDSKMPTPPIPAMDGERPESFVGDLPPPSTWSTNRPPNRRASTLQTPTIQSPGKQTPEGKTPNSPKPIVHQEPSRNLETNKSKRMSFSMPLKVNPSGPHAQILPSNNRRTSQMYQPDAPGESPTVHTLTAKVDASNRVPISQSQSTRSSPTQSSTQGSRPRSPSARLSLFPSPMPLPTGVAPQAPKRSSSSTALSSYAQQQAQTQVNAGSLKRPTSMQVRADHAPFLSSVRNSTGPPDGRAVPIRGMKPSRSASNVTASAKPSSPEIFQRLKFDTPTMPEEADRATPLPDRSASPLPSRPGSRSSGRKVLRTRSSLPQLDLGLPVVGLGPPAPPPSAPLPPPPPASRPSSPAPMDSFNPGIASVAGLGIRVS